MATVEEIKRPSYRTTSDGHRTRSRYFSVIGITTPDDAALGITKGSVYVDTEGTVDGGCLARDIQWTSNEQLRDRYTVTVNYDSKSSASNNTTDTGSGGGGGSANPLDEPAKYSARGSSVRVAITKDLDGKLIQNTAGSPLADVTETDLPRAILAVTKNEPAFFINQIAEFYLACNSTPWLGIPEAHARVVSIGAGQERTEFDQTYVAITYEFEIAGQRLDVTEVPNQGFQVKIDGNVENLAVVFDDEDGDGLYNPVMMSLKEAVLGKRRAVMKDGEPVEIPGPVFLNAAGNQWVAGLDPEEDKVLEFRTGNLVDFNSLTS